jgi:thiamine-monophosphate kinase
MHSGSGKPGELAILKQIRARATQLSHGAARSGLRLGIGDDCALLRVGAGEELAVTTDLSIAGPHFRLAWHAPESIGHRTLARGLSDLAAMGARPVAAFLSLGLPAELVQSQRKRVGKKPWPGGKTWLDRFLDGFFALAGTYQTPLAGGDLAESPIVVADIVLAGAVRRGKALLRSGARPGDLLYVTGTLGGSAAALARLAQWAEQAAKKLVVLKGHDFSRAESGSSSISPLGPEGSSFGDSSPVPDFSETCNTEPGAPRLTPETGRLFPPRIPAKLQSLLAPHLSPQPRIAQGLWLSRHALCTAAIDLSDGLSTDLAHLCEESAVAAEVDANALPIHPGATLAQVLHGGEDYELLFTASPAARVPRRIAGVPVTCIGRILRSRKGRPPVALIDVQVGAQGPQPLTPQGWEHFS